LKLISDGETERGNYFFFSFIKPYIAINIHALFNTISGIELCTTELIIIAKDPKKFIKWYITWFLYDFSNVVITKYARRIKTIPIQPIIS